MSTHGAAAENNPRERTLVGYAPAPVPVAPSIAVAAAAEEAVEPEGAPLDRRNPLSRRQPINRGRHLTRQFFEEGERQQEVAWESSPLASEDGARDPAISFESFDKVPSRRGPLLAGMFVLVLGIGGLVAWTFLGTPTAPSPAPLSTVPASGGVAAIAAVPAISVVPAVSVAPPAAPISSARRDVTTLITVPTGAPSGPPDIAASSAPVAKRLATPSPRRTVGRQPVATSRGKPVPTRASAVGPARTAQPSVGKSRVPLSARQESPFPPIHAPEPIPLDVTAPAASELPPRGASVPTIDVAPLEKAEAAEAEEQPAVGAPVHDGTINGGEHALPQRNGF